MELCTQSRKEIWLRQWIHRQMKLLAFSSLSFSFSAWSYLPKSLSHNYFQLYPPVSIQVFSQSFKTQQTCCFQPQANPSTRSQARAHSSPAEKNCIANHSADASLLFWLRTALRNLFWVRTSSAGMAQALTDETTARLRWMHKLLLDVGDAKGRNIFSCHLFQLQTMKV